MELKQFKNITATAHIDTTKIIDPDTSQVYAKVSENGDEIFMYIKNSQNGRSIKIHLKEFVEILSETSNKDTEDKPVESNEKDNTDSKETIEKDSKEDI
jgi:hypothetical protein